MTLAPVLGWGRYETFEYGCCIAFSDPSTNVRSYVVTALVSVFFLPICACLVCYSVIAYTANRCRMRLSKVKLFILKPFFSF